MTRHPVHESLAVPRVRVSVLQTGEIERIDDLSLDILAETGIIVHYPPARDLLRRHGADVDHTRQLVRIPRMLVGQALATAPRSFTLYSQTNSNRDCLLGFGGGYYARPASGLPWIVDARAKGRRPVTSSDSINWSRLAHALPNIHVVSAAYDQEGSPKAMELRSVATMLRYTDKPLMVSAVNGEGMRWIQRLVDVVQPPDRQPRVMVLSSVNSPLIYGYGQCEAAMVSAELGIPVAVNSSAVAGASAPVTLAGDLALMNAEMLAALTIIQLHAPGAPVIYAGHPVIMDMRTTIASFGFAEIGLLAAACIDIGRYYGLPTGSDGLTTDSCLPDANAALEKWASGYLPFLAGASISGGAGALASQGAISLEQLVIDDDIFGRFFRQMHGIELNDETLASRLIQQVGPAGTYLAEDHTRIHCRSEYYYSPVANRLGAASWEAMGSPDAVDRAAARVQSVLAQPAKWFVTEEQSRELERVLARAEEALSDIEVPI